ncbi:DUF2845 domain-containing protein [Marinobacter caseinilyticus]|uniref:DUF2845 domain-containing protein n=1 Tax=Marinobacter caseinilyticus TaxID=2692195 RepID=UPI001F1A33F4|nr:DUF2845 domain-containing protein [Marinobacter caseinilyticus]
MAEQRPALSITIAGVLMLALAMTAQHAAAAFRCGTSLVDVGDWPAEVEERCGAPDYVASYPAVVVAGLGVVRDIEHWYYNPGPQGFIRRLEFRDGLLRQERSLGYGFLGETAGNCAPARLQEGISEFELIARCGEPLSRRTRWHSVSSSRHHAGQVAAVMPVQEWLFEFGDQRFRRLVTLENGRVVRIETRKKPH